MPCVSKNVVAWAGQALLDGDFDRLLYFYADTVAAFTPHNVYRLSGRDELRAALAEHREGALREGVVGLTGEVAAVGLPRGPRHRMFVDWTYHMSNGRPARHASATYYCVKGAYWPQVEMIEYRKLAFDRSAAWHRGRALIQQPAAEVAAKAG